MFAARRKAPVTVESILGDFSKALERLDDLTMERHAAADKKAAEIADLEESMNADLLEVARAIKISNNIRNLLS